MNQTRGHLLRVARRLFAQGGYEGTSIRAITRKAGANLGAVTYHFGSKKTLYEQVLLEVTGPLARRLEAIETADAAPLDRIEMLVRGFFAHIREVPDMPALILRELALNRPLPEPARQTMGRVFQSVGQDLEAGQNEGSIVPGDVRHLVIAVIAQPIYAALAQRPLREVAGVDLRDATRHAQLVEDVVQFVRRGLEVQKGSRHA